MFFGLRVRQDILGPSSDPLLTSRSKVIRINLVFVNDALVTWLPFKAAWLLITVNYNLHKAF